MSDLLHRLGLQGVFTEARILTLIEAGIVLVVGVVLARVLTSTTVRLLRSRLTQQSETLLRRFLFYGLLVLVLTSVLHQLGFKLGVLLGAAGILTVAVGFASQTSASNLISGLFLLAERPFVVGDVVRIADVTGEILSVDLLSVKIRTFDNLYVRVPNEEIIKTHLTNLTHFPIRRVDLNIGVAYKEDMGRVREVLEEVAHRNPLCLEEPAPLFIFRNYGDSALEFQFSIWARRETFLQLRNSIMEEIKEAFDRHGIEIPFPQRTIHAGAHTHPFPVRIVEPGAGDPAAES